MNINTKEYWENRFASGDWENKGGRLQTRQFAETQIKYFDIPKNFDGVILDFGCGLGDAIPIYRAKYPNAYLVGMDISQSAIIRCREKYGQYAKFIQGGFAEVPCVNVIISSNVFEHLSNDIDIARHLKTRCDHLYIIVPYKQKISASTLNEHIRSYDENHFKEIGSYDYRIFLSRGYGEFNWRMYVNIYIYNIIRFFIGKTIIYRDKQIMFHFTS